MTPTVEPAGVSEERLDEFIRWFSGNFEAKHHGNYAEYWFKLSERDEIANELRASKAARQQLAELQVQYAIAHEAACRAGDYERQVTALEQQLAEMRGAVQEAVRVLGTGGDKKSDRAVAAYRILAALAPTSQPSRGKCETCGGNPNGVWVLDPMGHDYYKPCPDCAPAAEPKRDAKESPLAKAVRLARGDHGPPTEPVRWGDVFNRHLAKGEDHASAAYAADKAEAQPKRQGAVAENSFDKQTPLGLKLWLDSLYNETGDLRYIHAGNFLMAYDDANDRAIAALGEKGWISVSERLPKCSKKPDSFGVQVLIYPPYESEGSSPAHTAFYGRRITNEPGFYLYGRCINVTHWRELPSPPVSKCGSDDDL